MGLPAKIAAIYGEIQKLPKTERNPHHGYAYTGEGYIVGYVRGLLHKYGVALFCSMTGYTIQEIKPDKKDWTRVVCEFEFTLVDSETGETRTSVWFNAAEDNSDKGFNKAATAALKYFLLKTFLINTGEPDAHEGGEKINRAKQERRAEQRQPEPPSVEPTAPAGETAVVISAAPAGDGAQRHLVLKTADGKAIRAWTRKPFLDGGYDEAQLWAKEGDVYKIDPPALVSVVREAKYGGGEQWTVIPTVPAQKMVMATPKAEAAHEPG